MVVACYALRRKQKAPTTRRNVVGAEYARGSPTNSRAAANDRVHGRSTRRSSYAPRLARSIRADLSADFYGPEKTRAPVRLTPELAVIRSACGRRAAGWFPNESGRGTSCILRPFHRRVNFHTGARVSRRPSSGIPG
jgi:hypothetical protein